MGVHDVRSARLLISLASILLLPRGEVSGRSLSQDLSSNIGVPYNLLWTIDGAQNGPALMSGALDVGQDGWVAWGFPQSPGSGMLGGSVLLVKTDAGSPSGASVSSVYLGGYNAAAIKPPSQIEVLSMNASSAGGRLQALFKVRLNSSAAAVGQNPTSYIYAVGKLDQTGTIQKHDDTQGLEDQIQLGPGLATGAGPSQAPAGQPSSPPAAAPAPQTSLAFQSAAVEQCAVVVNGTPQTYAYCQPLLSGSSNLRMGWTLASDAKGNGTLMTGAFQCAAGGWCGWGFPRAAGEMIGASALIARTCAGCASEAEVDRYYLAGKSTSKVVSGQGTLDVQDMQAAKTPDGRLLAVFTLRLSPGDTLAARPILMAHGPVAGGGAIILAHEQSSRAAGMINLESGQVKAYGAQDEKELLAHGVLMGIALIVMLPISVVIAATMRFTLGPSMWFQIHRALGVLAFLAVVPGAVLGVVLWRQLVETPLLTAHACAGLIVLGSTVLQVLALAWRARPATKLRRFWNHYHHNVGRLVLLLAFANIMIGLYLAGQGWGWYLGIALVWLAIWVVGGLSSMYNRHRLHRSRSAGGRPIPSGTAPTASLNKPVA